MSACLWADIDAYLIAAVTADMGAASAYATLKIAGVEVGEIVNPEQKTLPFVLIRGYEASEGDDYAHGDGVIHLDNMRYPYEIFAFAVSATAAQAKIDAQELRRRLREMMRSRHALDGIAPASDGETVIQTNMTGGGVQVRGMAGSNRGAYLAAALLELEVITQI